MHDLSDRLKAALADRYRVDREIGRGGMATVYLADDLRHNRPVAIKVLKPDLASTLGPERFHREIAIAAKLQHPHVLPLLDSGDAGGFLYYVMPYVEGQSLRDRLVKERELPIGETVRLLRDVVDALTEAHGMGVVHRDIKPENILLRGRHALVTDFGVAKAVTEATGREQLTTAGMALGTPAYMAPEQAAADPHVDHRVDIYAVGAVAYELLTGRPVFMGTTPQMVLSAHVTEAPQPLATHRDTVPPALDALVMKCLEKKPADRWQSAEELLPRLEALATPSGGTTPTAAQPIRGADADRTLRRTHPLRVTALTGISALLVLAVAYTAVMLIGLPNWILASAAVVLVLAVPGNLLAARHERQRAQALLSGQNRASPTGIRRHLTLRKSFLASGIGVGAVALAALGFLVTRAMGIGPAATLMTQGVLTPADTLILVAEFRGAPENSTLAATVTAALRIDLGQSEVFSLVPGGRVRRALESMGRSPETVLTEQIAREVAARLNLKALVLGEVARLGTSYVLSASLIAAETGQVYAAARATASDDGEVVAAVDHLSKTLRAKIGESLRQIRASRPLYLYTSRSVEALRLYTQSYREADAGDLERSIAVLEEAIAIDSAFAEAHRRLAAVLVNAGYASRARTAATRAFEHRHRLRETERYLVEGFYYFYANYDLDRTINAYRSVLDRSPGQATAVNNLMIALSRSRRWAEAEELGRRRVYDDTTLTYYTLFSNLQEAQVAQGRAGAADTTVQLLAERTPESPWVPEQRLWLATARGAYASADSELALLRSRRPGSAGWWRSEMQWRYRLALVRGRVRDAETAARAIMRSEEETGGGAYFNAVLDVAWLRLLVFDDSAGASRLLDSALTRHPLEQLHPARRPYLGLALWYAIAGNAAEARRFEEAYSSEIPEVVQRGARSLLLAVRAAIATAEERWGDAIEGFRAADAASGCPDCWLWTLGRAFDAAGEADSAVAAFERALHIPSRSRIGRDTGWKARTLRRLGELYATLGMAELAVARYDEFAVLWQDADSELQPLVADARERIAQLVQER